MDNSLAFFHKDLERCSKSVNFEHLHTLFELNNWKWAVFRNGKHMTAVPTTDEIREVYDEMKEEIRERIVAEGLPYHPTGISTGRLSIEVDEDGYCKVTLDLDSH